MEKREDELVRSVIKEVLGNDFEKWKSCPSSWFLTGRYLTFRIGATYSIYSRIPIPNNLIMSGNIKVSKELGSSIISFVSDKEKITTDQKQAQRSLMGLLKQCKSTKDLQELWPEGKDYYEKYLKPETKVQLPAIRTDEINKLLGLPKGE